MSTLSAKCDRLRERAEEMRFLAPDPDVPYLIPSTKETMALAMRSAASEMEDAADTIWQLRNTNLDTANENDDLKAENEERRERVAELEELTDGKRYIPQEWYALLQSENAKLQKVCKRMRDHIKDSCDVCDEYYCSSWDEDNECCVFDTYMREIGVEVPDA